MREDGPVGPVEAGEVVTVGGGRVGIGGALAVVHREHVGLVEIVHEVVDNVACGEAEDLGQVESDNVCSSLRVTNILPLLTIIIFAL